MNWKTFLAGTLAAGVVGNAIDAVVQGGWFTTNYYSKLPQVFRQDGNIALFVLGDFVGVAVLAWFYQVVRGSFAPGLKGGLWYGVCMGIVTSFPMFIFLHLMLVGWPYGLSWAMTIHTIIWCAVVGAILGAVHQKLST